MAIIRQKWGDRGLSSDSNTVSEKNYLFFLLVLIGSVQNELVG